MLNIIQKYPQAPRSLWSDVLKILDDQKIGNMPTDIRTILNTPRFLDFKQLSGGQYVHIGLKNCLNTHKNFFSNSESNIIEIQINIDSLPITNSNNDCIWPILGCIVNGFRRSKCFVIGMFYGKKKPTCFNTFLSDFCNDLNDAFQNVLVIDMKHYKIKIQCFICDSPAKSNVTYTISHTSLNACNKCLIKGRYDGYCIVFDNFDSHLTYTDENFVKKSNLSHHKGVSILENLGIKMVSQFPNDYMHLVLLGTMKRLITYWVKGPFDYKFNADTINDFDTYLLSFNKTICKEFQRKHRKIIESAYWKATEFRLFLLYTGLIVVKKFLNLEYYEHFLSLHYAIRILSSKKMYKKYNSYAESLLKFFVEKGNDLYEHFVVYNTHNLIHLPSDCIQFGQWRIYQ